MVSSSYARRIICAFSGALFFRYLNWLFLLSAGKLQKLKVSENNYSLLCKWDCNFYEKLAENVEPTAFFPLFPWISSVFVKLLGLPASLSVIITSNIFSILSGIAVLFLGESLWKANTALPVFGFKPVSWMLLAAIALFPHAHFWIHGYPEPLFFLLIVCGVLSVNENRYRFAAIFFGAAAVTRPQGIWSLGLFGLLLLFRIFRTFSQPKSAAPQTASSQCLNLVIAGTIALTPLGLFLVWNFDKTGNALHFLSAQQS